MTPPKILLDLIEAFNFFGKLVPDPGSSSLTSSMADYEAYTKEKSEWTRAELTKFVLQN